MPPPTPRHELATAAYSHACAVLGPDARAVEAAVLAVGRGGRALGTVLGHARDAAVSMAGETGPPDLAEPSAEDLESLAVQLSFLRPPLERAVIDLSSRYGLDAAALARALGTSPSEAATTAAEVAGTWQRCLDPILLAHLGGGSCAELSSLLEDPGATTDAGGTDASGPPASPPLTELAAAGERAAAHAEECAVCGDRLRAMVSVRTLLAQRPLPHPPEEVLAAAAVAKLRPTELPAPGRTATVARTRLAVVAAVVAVVAGVVAVLAARGGDDHPSAEVDALTSAAAVSGALAVRPGTVVLTSGSTVRLRTQGKATSWHATSDRPWLRVDPADGDIGPDQTVAVRITAADDAPEGESRASVTFAGADGSTAVVAVRATIDRPPDIAVERDGCGVVATVEDDSEVVSVALEQQGRPAVPLTAGAGGWTGTLAPGGATWSVKATDAFGNEGRSPLAPASGC